MSATGFRIRIIQDGPNLHGRLCSREKRLDRVRYGAKESTEDQAVLSLPQRVRRIHNGGIVCRDGGVGDNRRSIQVTREVIAVEQRSDLTTPH